jgi:stage V sporulation protein B
MKNKKVKKETFLFSVLILIISQVFIKLLGLAYRLYLTNREGFGDKGNAIYSSGYQIYALLLTLSSVGVPNAISKLVSEKVAIGNYMGANRIFKVSFITFAIIGVFGTILLFESANYVANVILQIPEAELTLVALSPSLFFVSIISVMRGYFNGIEKISITAKSQILEQVFKTLITIILVEIVVIFNGTNTTIMAAGANLATTFSIILSFVYLLFLYKKNTNKFMPTVGYSKYKKDKIVNIIKEILYVSIPISLTAILGSLNKNIDAITVIRSLKTFLSEEEAKIQYGILCGKVDTIITLPMSFNIAFATALVPTISAAKATKDDYIIEEKVSFSLLITMLIGFPCTLGLFLFSDPIIKLLFPNATSGAQLLSISAIAIIFVVITQTLNGVLQGLGKVSIPMMATLIGLVFKIILNIILVKIPNIGINGAAIASIVNNIIVCVIEFFCINKILKIKFNFNKLFLKPLIATIIMGISSYYLYIFLLKFINFELSIILSLIFAIIIYIIFILILKIFTKEELTLLFMRKNI